MKKKKNKKTPHNQLTQLPKDQALGSNAAFY